MQTDNDDIRSVLVPSSRSDISADRAIHLVKFHEHYHPVISAQTKESANILRLNKQAKKSFQGTARAPHVQAHPEDVGYVDRKSLKPFCHSCLARCLFHY